MTMNGEKMLPERWSNKFNHPLHYHQAYHHLVKECFVADRRVTIEARGQHIYGYKLLEKSKRDYRWQMLLLKNYRAWLKSNRGDKKTIKATTPLKDIVSAATKPQGREFFMTTNARRILAARNFIRIVEGGFRSGKTAAILMDIINNCWVLRNWEVSVLGRNFQGLDLGAISLMRKIMIDFGIYDAKRWNNSDKIYKFHNGSHIKFLSAERVVGLPGIQQDQWFFNEANFLPWEFVRENIARTKGNVWIDYNPSAWCWVHREFVDPAMDGKTDRVDYIDGLTFEGNEGLSSAQLAFIDQFKDANSDYWKIMGQGILSKDANLILPDYKILYPMKTPSGWIEIPHQSRMISRGLDYGGWGRGRSKMAMNGCYSWGNNSYILDQELYHDDIDMRNLGAFILSKPTQVIVYSDLNPGFTNELKAMNIPIHEVPKGPGSIESGLKLMRGYKLWVTARSVDLIKELDGYYFKNNRDGSKSSAPAKSPDDLIDSSRYSLTIARGYAKINEDSDVNRYNDRYAMSNRRVRNRHVKRR